MNKKIKQHIDEVDYMNAPSSMTYKEWMESALNKYVYRDVNMKDEIKKNIFKSNG